MRKAVIAGVAYFATVFAAGFVLGALRLTTLAPAFGELAATLIEVPVLVAFSWAACKKVITWMTVAARVNARLLMGAVAFGLLMIAEFGVAIGLMHQQPSEVLENLASLPALIGLGGQILFALFPILSLIGRR